MNDKIFPELARRLKREGIATGSVENGHLPVLLEERAEQSNQRELEAADQQTGGPGWEMSP